MPGPAASSVAAPRPSAAALPSFRMTTRAPAGIRPPTREPQAGPRREGVAHRPALPVGLGHERNAVRGREGIDPDVAAAARERLHHRPAVGRGVAGQRMVEQHVVAGQAEDGHVRRERDRDLARHRRALVRVGAHQPRHGTPAEHRVPPRQRLRGVGQAARERVRRVERIGRGHAQEPRPARGAPLAVAVQQLDPPRPGQVPARPPEVGARAHGMRREGERRRGRARPRARRRRRRRSGSRDRGCRGRGGAPPWSRARCRRSRARRRGSPRAASRRGCCGR